MQRETSGYRLHLGLGSLSLLLWGYSAMSLADDAKPHFKAKYSEEGMLAHAQQQFALADRSYRIKPTLQAASQSMSHTLSNALSATQSVVSEQLVNTGFKVYRYQQVNGVMAFSDHIPLASQYQSISYSCYACDLDSVLDWRQLPLFISEFDDLIELAAITHDLDPALIRAVIHAESAFNVFALSRAGAMGLMQLMPATARELGVSNAFLPEQNIDGGSRYLAAMLARFDGDIALACAAYNAGPSTVTRYQGIPPYPETQAYVKRVQLLLARYRQDSIAQLAR